MRSTYMYRDQVQKVTNWFQSWNECEQTVALFSLLRKLSSTQNKFLLQVLEQSFQESTEIQTREKQANNPVYVKSLCAESKDHAVTQLLLCLPLLRPGNTEAKLEYLNVLPRVLNHSVENGCHIEESRQLLSYSLIHPAMDSKERNRLAMWLTHLEERYAYNVYHQTGQQQGAITPDGQVNPELITHILDKTTDLANNTYNGNHSNGVQLTANWQQSNSNEIDVNSQSKNGGNSGQNQNNGSGRAITSTSAKTGLMTGHPAGLDLNYNGAGFAVDSHIPLHATLSGPPAFCNVPSSQAINTSSLLVLSQHGNNNNNGCGNTDASNMCHRKLTRSMSAVPSPTTAGAGSHVSDWLNRHHEEMVQGVMYSTIATAHSEPPHAPLSPQSSISSSGSGSDGQGHEGGVGGHGGGDPQQMRNTFLEEGSGMRDVPVWLKSLRLHKYSYLFQTMTYEDMMGLNEDWLKSQNVTKGARNKIILNIKKLHERQNCIRAMEKEVMESGNMKQALTELKSMMNTPLKAYIGGSPSPTAAPPNNNNNNQTSGDETANTSNSTEFNSSNEGSGIEGSAGSVESVAEKSPSGGSSDNLSISGATVPTNNGEGDLTTDGDLPSQITRVLGKVCTQLLVSTRPEDECFSMYLQLLDKCMMHEAFSAEQKRKLLSWRQQIQKIWHPLPQRYGIDRQRKGFGNTFPPNNLLRGQRALRGQPVLKPGQPKWTFGGRPPITIAPIGAVTGTVPLYCTSAAFPSSPFAPIIPTMVEQLKAPITRTHSAPIKSNQFGFAQGCRPGTEASATEPEINARLDSLCLSMTEHALGGFSDML